MMGTLKKKGRGVGMTRVIDSRRRGHRLIIPSHG